MSDTIGYYLGGTLRTRRANETLQVIQPLIKQAGITRIANLTGLDNIGLPVYTCIRPFSRNLSTSQGKGITHELAQCSSYMESLEHFYAEKTPVATTAAESELDPNAAIFHHRFSQGIFHTLTPHKKTPWTFSENLLDGKQYLIPTALVNFNFTQTPVDAGTLHVSSTGLASGNSLTEATCHGLYECIERHSTHTFNQLSIKEKSKYCVCNDTINDDDIIMLLDQLTSANINYLIFDLSSIFDIPTYQCFISDKQGVRGLGQFNGSGTHLVKKIALSRAITEAIQSRLTLIAGSRDDLYPSDYQPQHEINCQPTINYHETETADSLNLQQHLETLKNHFVKKGYKYLLRITHTPPDLPISVSHLLIPGLCL